MNHLLNENSGGNCISLAESEILSKIDSFSYPVVIYER